MPLFATDAANNRWLDRLTPRAALCMLTVLCLASASLPVSAITLVKCKIGKKTVYSDTDCPSHRATGSGFTSGFGPASKPIRIKLPRKQATGMLIPPKSRSSRAGKSQ